MMSAHHYLCSDLGRQFGKSSLSQFQAWIWMILFIVSHSNSNVFTLNFYFFLWICIDFYHINYGAWSSWRLEEWNIMKHPSCEQCSPWLTQLSPPLLSQHSLTAFKLPAQYSDQSWGKCIQIRLKASQISCWCCSHQSYEQDTDLRLAKSDPMTWNLASDWMRMIMMLP